VLAYDGRTDLAYKLQQDSRLKDGHILTGMSRPALQTLLLRWGLRPSTSVDESTVLDVATPNQEFQVQLFCPHPKGSGDFWEIHCLASLELPHDQALALIKEVNGTPYLMKAFAVPAAGNGVTTVRLALGINLAGGVTIGGASSIQQRHAAARSPRASLNRYSMQRIVRSSSAGPSVAVNPGPVILWHRAPGAG
jgi:hypothetical protein